MILALTAQDSFGGLTNSSGKSIPTLLAVSLTLSSSSMFIPGLYLSKSVAYIRCALTYCRNCSACSTGVLEFEARVVRIRSWSGDREWRPREGSSRRKARYMARNLLGFDDILEFNEDNRFWEFVRGQIEV